MKSSCDVLHFIYGIGCVTVNVNDVCCRVRQKCTKKATYCCFAPWSSKQPEHIVMHACVSVSRVPWSCIWRWSCCTWSRAGGRSTRTAWTWSRGRSSEPPSSPHWEQSGSKASSSSKKVIFHTWCMGTKEACWGLNQGWYRMKQSNNLLKL